MRTLGNKVSRRGRAFVLALAFTAGACSYGLPAEVLPAAQRAEALAQRIASLYEAGRYPEGIPLAEALLANQIEVFGPEDEEIAYCSEMLGVLLSSSGRPREAIPHHERAVAILTRRFGADAADTAHARDLLGTAKLLAGDLAGAEKEIAAALQIFSTTDPGSAETANALNSLGYVRRLQGRWSEARQLFQESLAVFSKRRGKAATQTLPVLRNLAALDAEAGDLTIARQSFEKALAISRRVLGEKHPDTARVEGELAEVLVELGQLPQAKELYSYALATAEKILGARHPDRARYLGGLGSVALAQGDYRRAKDYFEKALATYEAVRGEEHPDTATAATNLGTVLEILGQAEKAVPYHERALAIDRKKYGDRSLQTAATLANLGVAKEDLGEFAVARSLFEESLEIRREKLPPGHPAIAQSLTNLGALSHALGDLAAAQTYYEEALAIRHKALGPVHSRTASSWNNLGAVCEERGDLVCARENYERALAIWEEAVGPDHPDTALGLNNLGMVLAALGYPERALQLLTRARAIWEKAYGPDHPAVATSLENLASLFNFIDDPESERDLLERALDIRIRKQGEKHIDVALTHHNLGSVLHQLGRLPESRHHLERAVALREELLGADHPDTAASLRELAATEVAAQNLDRALDLAERAATIEERRVRSVLRLGSDEQRRLFQRTTGGGMHWAVTVHLRHRPDDPRAARLALTAILRNKGRALDFSALQRRQLRRLGADVQGLLRRLAELRREQAALLLRPAPSRSSLEELAAEIRKVEAELARRGASEESESPAIDLAAVQKALPPEAALIEFVVYQPWDAQARGNPWGTPRYAAYVLRATGEPAGIDLGEAAAIDQKAESFRQALAQSWIDPTPAGRHLDVLTLEKLRPLLGDAQTLLIAPDGDLNLIPFAALIDEHGSYRIERYRISYLASGRELLPDREETCENREPPLVIGGPDFGAPVAAPKAGDPYPASVDPLDGAAAEAAAIGTLFDLAPSRILTGSSASETAIKLVHGPRVLHLATHGFFLPDSSAADTPGAAGDRLPARARETQVEVYLRSGVALAGYNRRQQARGPDDGLLTALEAMELDLCGTELVTLSACETGLGEARSGQGVFGLRRALALAGARSQLLTLWKVADQATKDFMVSFYAQARQGVPPAEALRRTQLAALQASPGTESDPRGVARLGEPAPRWAAGRAHPYYWASFVLSGRAKE